MCQAYAKRMLSTSDGIPSRFTVGLPRTCVTLKRITGIEIDILLDRYNFKPR